MKRPFASHNQKQAEAPPPANDERADPQAEPRLRIEVLEPRVAAW